MVRGVSQPGTNAPGVVPNIVPGILNDDVGRAIGVARHAGANAAWAIVYGTILLAWLAVWIMDPLAGLPPGSDVFGADHIRALCLAAVENASLPALWGMWAVMGLAMMLPGAVPALRDYAQLADTAAARGGEPHPQMAVLALAGGYVSVWFGFAVIAALAQIVLSDAGLLDGTGASGSLWLSAALLAMAGAYQFSTLKNACLSACRSPMLRFIAGWRPGPLSAFRMGTALGAHCVGCCWALMALAFVGGAMNLAFMGLATVLMTLEKLPEWGGWLTRPLGLVLLMGSAAAIGAGFAL